MLRLKNSEMTRDPLSDIKYAFQLFASDKSGAIIFHELRVDAGVVWQKRGREGNG
jgi:Ca2+-binding EF-hand superfamily protein